MNPFGSSEGSQREMAWLEVAELERCRVGTLAQGCVGVLRAYLLALRSWQRQRSPVGCRSSGERSPPDSDRFENSSFSFRRGQPDIECSKLNRIGPTPSAGPPAGWDQAFLSRAARTRPQGRSREWTHRAMHSITGQFSRAKIQDASGRPYPLDARLSQP